MQYPRGLTIFVTDDDQLLAPTNGDENEANSGIVLMKLGANKKSPNMGVKIHILISFNKRLSFGSVG